MAELLQPTEQELLGIRASCEHYGIDLEEGIRRFRVLREASRNQWIIDPVCARRPEEIGTYRDMAQVEECTPDEYVRREEGTFNPETLHFLCDECYIACGQPSSPSGWRCP